MPHVNVTEFHQSQFCTYYIVIKKSKYQNKELYFDCLRRESNFLASTPPVTALCVCVCCIVGMCDCVMVIHEPTRK